jgi:hypothetical protein
MKNDILDYLYNNHYNYYSSCYIEYIKEAISKTIKDLKINDISSVETLEAIHKHIKENYI